MLLTIDVGNTNIMLGLYANAALGPHWRLATDHERMPDEYAMQLINLLSYVGVNTTDIDGVALASGVPGLTTRWIEVCRRYLKLEPLVVHGRMKTGLTILYDNPDAVGADRVVDAVAAYTFYGGPLCIVDFGTATTFEAVTAAGEYLGGAIAPASALRPMRWPNARPNCRPSTSPCRRRPSAATRSTPCSPVSSGAMSAWSKAWSPASKRNWDRIPR